MGKVPSMDCDQSGEANSFQGRGDGGRGSERSAETVYVFCARNVMGGGGRERGGKGGGLAARRHERLSTKKNAGKGSEVVNERRKKRHKQKGNRIHSATGKGRQESFMRKAGGPLAEKQRGHPAWRGETFPITEARVSRQ